jgi:hypothetical protein
LITIGPTLVALIVIAPTISAQLRRRAMVRARPR